jgi:hypothetical protein
VIVYSFTDLFRKQSWAALRVNIGQRLKAQTWDLWIDIFHQYWEILSCYLLNFFSALFLSSLLDSNYTYVGPLIMSHISSVFSILFAYGASIGKFSVPLSLRSLTVPFPSPIHGVLKFTYIFHL